MSTSNGVTGHNATRVEREADPARVRRKAKARILKRLSVCKNVDSAMRDPALQRAVATLFVSGYTPTNISRATRDFLTENQILSILRAVAEWRLPNL